MSANAPVLPSLRGRILVIEEASVFREMQSLLLRGAGYDVVNCSDLASTREIVAKERLDAVVLNTSEPGADSAEFLTQIRQVRASLAVVFIAPAVTLELTRHLMHIGMTTVIQRPVNPYTLVEKVNEILNKAPTVTPPSVGAPSDSAASSVGLGRASSATFVPP